MRITATLLLLGVLTAQPAPTPSAPDVSGTWMLDKDISANLTKLDFIPHLGSGNGGGNRTQGRPRRGGFGGFGGGGFGGGSRQPQSESKTLTKEEQTRAKALAEDVKTGWAKLVISQRDGTLVINDEKDRTYFLKTDGSPADNHVGTLTLSSTTRVDGDHLVTEWPAGSQLTLVYTYTPVSNGRQLVVRVMHKSGPDAHEAQRFEPSVYLLYKRSSS
jgi:hypothetical protein